MKRILIVTLLLAATPARAGQLGQAILWSGAAADVASTWRGHLYGLHEGNPLIGDRKFAAPVAIIGTATAVDLVARWFVRGGHPKTGRNLRILVGGFHFAGASRNLWMIRRQKNGIR